MALPSRLLLGVFVAAATVSRAQAAARPLTNIVATSTDSLVGSIAVRPLRNGGFLVLENLSGRLQVFDSALKARPFDSSGTEYAALMPFRGDSSVLMERATVTSLIVIDPFGVPGRAVATPRALLTGRTSVVGFDNLERFVIRSPGPVFLSLVPPEFEGDTVLAGPDSLPILRANFTTRVTDTVAFYRAPRVRQLVTRTLGRGQGRPIINPASGGDDVLVLANGTIAIIRAQDYHVDWITADGRRSSTGRLPGAWMRLTDSIKTVLLDSASAVVAGRGRGGVVQRFAERSEMADSLPPFILGQSRADAASHLWIRVRGVAQGGATYDVLDRDGVIIDRVQLPSGTTLLGFGPAVALVSSPVSRSAFRLMTIKVR
jgi:hypothetical protein